MIKLCIAFLVGDPCSRLQTVQKCNFSKLDFYSFKSGKCIKQMTVVDSSVPFSVFIIAPLAATLITNLNAFAEATLKI